MPHLHSTISTPTTLMQSRSILITGGSFTQTWTAVNMDPTGLHLLSRSIALGAMHDSSERYPPLRCRDDQYREQLELAMNWAEGPSNESNVHWITTPPRCAGPGCTAIAQILAEKLGYKGRLAGSFFFERGKEKRDTSQYLFSTLAYQIAMNVPGMRELINAAMVNDPTLPTKFIGVQLKTLITDPFLELEKSRTHPMPVMTVIIDSLHECETLSVQSDILKLLGHQSSALAPLRFFLLCPQDSELVDFFARQHCWERTVYLACEDDEKDQALDFKPPSTSSGYLTASALLQQQQQHPLKPVTSTASYLALPPIPAGLPQRQLQQQPQKLLASAASFCNTLPLISTGLPHMTITVSHSFVQRNDRGKEVLSFIVFVDPGSGKEGWKVEKMYSDVLNMDERVRNSMSKAVVKKIRSLPNLEAKLWKDHAPTKVDQRKASTRKLRKRCSYADANQAALESYLQSLIQLPVKNNDEVIAFLTSDIIREEKQAVMQAGRKEGYLTKKGKRFGGWKTRFFVLQGPVLEYYDCRGGAHLGSIIITNAQLARQHKTERTPNADDETEYRHSFLIIEAKKGPGGNHPRHVLCAESDDARDSWIEMLLRYYTGTYSEDLVFNSASGLTNV